MKYTVLENFSQASSRQIDTLGYQIYKKIPPVGSQLFKEETVLCGSIPIYDNPYKGHFIIYFYYL